MFTHFSTNEVTIQSPLSKITIYKLPVNFNKTFQASLNHGHLHIDNIHVHQLQNGCPFNKPFLVIIVLKKWLEIYSHKMPNIKIFTGSSHPTIGQPIMERLGHTEGKCILKKFANNESWWDCNKYFNIVQISFTIHCRW